MVKPNQPKGIKPKAEVAEAPTPSPGSGGFNIDSLSGLNIIIINTVISVVICFIFLMGNFLIVNGIVGSKLENIDEIIATAPVGEHEEEHSEYQRGIIIDLGEFIVNLSDPAAKRYLKVNVALELSKSEHDPDLTAHAESGGGGHGGHGGGNAPDPLEVIEKEMKQFKPAMRDSIISVLSSRTPEELSSLAGKELAKQDIKDAIDPIFQGERNVMRVSFGSFIIQ